MSAEAVLARARAGLRRVAPHELAGLSDVLVVDIRPHHNRLAEGEVPGSVPVERIVLEWRLDPTGEYRIPGFGAETTVVVLCNEGYASSLAARDLQQVGLPNATDLIGGFRAYAEAGLPIREGATPAVV
ncbi:rhodanese-like domain-containing protein [Actinosynnema sp. NPDC050436]|uniref:rhodanese-like domain-containing protein n=1 Tax=Actinosynnema sp. NPDC050436 TaxID=3155659 RepID=UPI0033F15D67